MDNRAREVANSDSPSKGTANQWGFKDETKMQADGLERCPTISEKGPSGPVAGVKQQLLGVTSHAGFNGSRRTATVA